MTKTVVITGCSSGFGELAAKELAKQGHRVYASMRGVNGKNKDKASALSAFAKEHGVDIRPIEIDVTSTESVNAAAAQINKESGAADVVINNAGQMYLGITECFDDQELTKQLDTNVVGVHRMNRAFLPAMRKSGKGLVINISSVAGRITIPFFGVYHASKWALEGYSQAMRTELASSGVDVVVIEPGPFSTNLFGTTPTPSDKENRGGTYPKVVHETFEGLNNAFAGIFENPDAPTDPMIVVNRMCELVAMKPGSRPFRSVCGENFGVSELNTMTDAYYDGVTGAMGLNDFATLK